MPLPFILLGAAAVAGGVGVVAGLEAKEKMSCAKEIGEKAKNMADQASAMRDSAREATNASLENLGMTKMDILANSMNTFVYHFSRIKNVDLSESIGLDELRKFNPQSKEFMELKKATFKAVDIASGGLGGAAAGGLAAAGAYSTVSFLATASTGTAIAGLSGAAATNATLAWLGGGALSAGGFGIAGGMAVLGGIVAAPALLIGGIFLSEKADEAYSKAQTYMEESKKFCTECENLCSLMNAISNRADQIESLLVRLDSVFIGTVVEMEDIINHAGNNWNRYTAQEKKSIATSAQLAQTIKNIIDTSLLHEDGKLNSDSERVLMKGNELYERF